MRYVSAYLVALVIFLVLDALWIGVVARGFYLERIGELLRAQPDFIVAGLFYAIYVAGLVYFAIAGGLAGGGWMRAATDGALFGFFAYLTYNATNLAVMRGYDAVVAAVDTAWGAFAGGLIAGLTVLLVSAFPRG
jgi:uncharacterized membrane protein